MAIAERAEMTGGQKEDAGSKIARHASLLSQQLQELRTRMYPPKSEKSLRPFLTNEVSKLTSIPDSTLKLMSSEGRGPLPGRLENNHRVYSLSQINELGNSLQARSHLKRSVSPQEGAPASISRLSPSQTSKAVVRRPRPVSI